MNNNFSDIEDLLDNPEDYDDYDEESNWEHGYENGRKVIKISYSLRSWPESVFLEHNRIMFADTTHYNVHKITLKNGKVVYLVPEKFYESRVEELPIYVKKKGIRE